MKQGLGNWWRSLVTVAGLVQRINVTQNEIVNVRRSFKSVLHEEFKTRQRLEQQLQELVEVVNELLPAPAPPPLAARTNLEAAQMRARELLTELSESV